MIFVKVQLAFRSEEKKLPCPFFLDNLHDNRICKQKHRLYSSGLVPLFLVPRLYTTITTEHMGKNQYKTDNVMLSYR